LIAIVVNLPTEPPSKAWATEHLPIPTELLIYSVDQWRLLLSANSRRFFDVLTKEAVWLVGSPTGVA
jgi:hypothetical protein